jgi:hypothetical protein
VLFSPFCAATRYLPRISFSAISRAFASEGLKAYWSIGPVFKQQIADTASCSLLKLLSSIIEDCPSFIKINDRGVKVTL